MNVKFVNVSIGAEEVYMLAVITPPVSIQRTSGCRRDSARELIQIVVHPSGPGMDVKFVNMSIGSNEVHMLTAVASPVSIQRTSGSWRHSTCKPSQIIVHPSGP